MNKPVKGRNIPEDVIQLVQCDVATGPHQQTIVRRGFWRPVTYPEALLLEHIHQQPGKPEPVRRMSHAGYVKRSAKAEKARLVRRYGAAVVEDVFPGRAPQMERFYQADAPKPGTKCKAGDFAGAKEPIEPDPVEPEPALADPAPIEPDPAPGAS